MAGRLKWEPEVCLWIVLCSFIHSLSISPLHLSLRERQWPIGIIPWDREAHQKLISLIESGSHGSGDLRSRRVERSYNGSVSAQVASMLLVFRPIWVGFRLILLPFLPTQLSSAFFFSFSPSFLLSSASLSRSLLCRLIVCQEKGCRR
jgi:hypothetical protein